MFNYEMLNNIYGANFNEVLLLHKTQNMKSIKSSFSL